MWINLIIIGLMNLPKFKYHPDPLSTGAIEASEAICDCCEQSRGYICTAGVYAEKEIEHVCPWCIADGSVHEKFDGELVDSHPLIQAGLPQSVVDEVSQRTPGYISWQQESWMSCCNDACGFHGDAQRDELLQLDEAGVIQLAQDSGFSVDDLPEIIKHYQPKGSPAFYKFVCRNCGKVRYNGDCD